MTLFFKKEYGFSLIELLIIIGIVILLIVMIVPSLASFRKNQALQNTTNAIVSLLQEARGQTLASYNTTFYSVRFETDRAILFSGGSYNSSDTTNKVVVFDIPVVLQTTVLNGGGVSVSFDRLKGTTSQHGTITIGISGGESRTVSISSSGVITRN